MEHKSAREQLGQKGTEHRQDMRRRAGAYKVEGLESRQRRSTIYGQRRADRRAVRTTKSRVLAGTTGALRREQEEPYCSTGNFPTFLPKSTCGVNG